MGIMRTILACAVFAATLAGQPVSAAQSTAVTSGVTVIRGVEDPGDVKHGRTTRERGVTVFRGDSTPYTFPEPENMNGSEVQVITSGDNLWLVNPKTGDLNACQVRRNIYDQLTVDCASK